MNDEKPGGEIRIGDLEREDAVRRLGEHYEAGRLSAEEHQERVGEALQAKTRSQVDVLFADLPVTGQGEGAGGEGWAGPWGWTRPPWTAAETGPADPGSAGPGWAGPGGPGRGGPGGAQYGRPGWAARGFLWRIPLPVLIALAVVGVLASIWCVVGGGHPPILPLLIAAGVVVYTKRRQERGA